MSGKGKAAKEAYDAVSGFIKGTKKPSGKAERVSTKPARETEVPNTSKKPEIETSNNRPKPEVESPKPNSTKPNETAKPKEKPNKKDKDNEVDMPASNKRTKGKEKKKDKDRLDDVLDEMSRRAFGKDTVGAYRPEHHTGILGVYFNSRDTNRYLEGIENNERNDLLGQMTRNKGMMFGKLAFGLSNVMAYAGNGIGIKEAAFLDENAVIKNFRDNKEEAEAVKNINVATFAKNMGLDNDVLTPADMAEAIKNGDGRKDFEALTLGALNSVFEKKEFALNMQNLEKSIESIGQAFNVSKDGILSEVALKEQSKFIKDAIGDYEKLTKEQDVVLGKALDAFHLDIAKKGELDFKALTENLKTAFSKEQIDDIIAIIDERRKTEIGYVAHNVNVYASLAEKREEVKDMQKLLGSNFDKKSITTEELKNFINENSYADLMAVVRNMPIDDDINTKLKISDLAQDKGVYEAQKLDSLKVENQANRLSTILEVNEILEKGKVDLVKKLDNQEQLSLDKLLGQDKMQQNPFNITSRGNMSVYFRDKDGELVANNSITIASIVEGKSNLGNILNFNTNHDSSLAIIEALNRANLLNSRGGMGLNKMESLDETIARNIKDFKSENLQILQNIKNGNDNNAYFNNINMGATSSYSDEKKELLKGLMGEYDIDLSANENEKKRISEIADFCAEVKGAFHDRRNIVDEKSMFSEDLPLSAEMKIEPQVVGTDRQAIEEARSAYEKIATQETAIKQDEKIDTNIQEQERQQRELKEQQERERIRLEEERIKEQEKQERWEKIKTFGWIALNVATCFTPAGAVFKGLQLVARGIEVVRTAKFAESAVALTKSAEVVEKGLHAVNNSKIINNVVTRTASDMAILDKVEDTISQKMN